MLERKGAVFWSPRVMYRDRNTTQIEGWENDHRGKSLCEVNHGPRQSYLRRSQTFRSQQTAWSSVLIVRMNKWKLSARRPSVALPFPRDQIPRLWPSACIHFLSETVLTSGWTSETQVPVVMWSSWRCHRKTEIQDVISFLFQFPCLCKVD